MICLKNYLYLLKTINDGLKFLEENKLILKKTTGYIIIGFTRSNFK